MPFGETLTGDFAHRRKMKIAAKDGAKLVAAFRMFKIPIRANFQKSTTLWNTTGADPGPVGYSKN